MTFEVILHFMKELYPHNSNLDNFFLSKLVLIELEIPKLLKFFFELKKVLSFASRLMFLYIDEYYYF